jgi:hypothetical protein
MSRLDWLNPRKLVVERDRALRDRDGALREREQAHAERDGAFLERVRAVAERAAALLERDRAVAERDAALRERDQALAGRNHAALKGEQAVAERAAALLERDQALVDRGHAALKGDKALVEHDAALRERDQALIERDRAAGDRDRAYALRDAAIADRDLLKEIQSKVAHIQQVTSLIARRSAAGRTAIRVLFVMHFSQAWKALEGVYRVMADDPDFEPIVATIDHRFDEAKDFEGEELLHDELTKVGIPHLRWGSFDGNIGRALVTGLAPDVVFLQTHWDGSFPEPLRAANIGFARTCYVHYGQEITGGGADAAIFNSEYLLCCWRIFCSSALAKSMYEKHSKMGALNVVVAGNPKFDHLSSLRHESGVWPVAGEQRKFRLLWSVHHSAVDGGYRYGAFIESYPGMLEWAGREVDIEFVLTFHHLFLEKVVATERLAREKLDGFLSAWKALPNTGLYDDADIGPVFAASDAHVTDCVSFLVEYQVMDKPLISLESGNPYPFNELGERILKGVYRVRSVDEAADLVNRFRHDRYDPLREERAAVANELMPFPEGASRRIMNEIRQSLRAEWGEMARS